MSKSIGIRIRLELGVKILIIFDNMTVNINWKTTE